MLHRIRLAMQNGSLLKVGGNGREVEADEVSSVGKPATCTSLSASAVFTSTGIKDKVAAIGVLERGGKIRTTFVPSRSDADRFSAVMPQVAGKRLTFAEVTGKVGETIN